jgi:Domain of unknown function (DUF4345)
MAHKYERRALQTTIAILALVPIGAGLAGAIQGPSMIGAGTSDIALDSHFRYLSGLLLGIGLAFWGMIPSIEKHRARFLLLTAIVFIGGLARAASLVAIGIPSKPMLGALAIELVVTPLLCLWQRRVAREAIGAGA